MDQQESMPTTIAEITEALNAKDELLEKQACIIAKYEANRAAAESPTWARAF